MNSEEELIEEIHLKNRILNEMATEATEQIISINKSLEGVASTFWLQSELLNDYFIGYSKTNNDGWCLAFCNEESGSGLIRPITNACRDLRIETCNRKFEILKGIRGTLDNTLLSIEYIRDNLHLS